MRITQHPDGTITIDTGGHAAKEIAQGSDTVAGRIFKADAAQRKTWHVFYPANKADVAVAMDGHKDFAGKAAVEKAAHDYLLKHRKVGLMHADGTDGSGDLVESGIHHGPDWVMKAADDTEQKVLDGDWVGAIRWDVQTWERWEKGELRGVSPQGGALRADASEDALAGLRKGAGNAAKGDVQVTELVEFEVTRVDGVISPANGFPVLMMKGLGDPDAIAKGARDCPKCEKSYDADHQGSKCENCGTDLPDAPAAKAADTKVDCPTCDGDGKIMAGKRDCPDCDASGKVSPDKAKQLTAKSAAEPWRNVPDIDTTGWPAADARFFELFKLLTLSKAKYSAADRSKMAEQGNALSDGSYPVGDEEDLKSAAILAQSGHGDVEGAKRLITRRSKELGVKNPLDNSGDASKSEIAKEGTTVDTVTQTGELTELVKAAVTEATAPLTKRIEALDAELAKVKATPVQDGPVLSGNVQVKRPGGVQDHDLAAQAALMRKKAADAVSPSDRDGYLAYARELDDQARKTVSSA